MVAIALRWVDFGGCDEFTLTEFGLQPLDFYLRLNAIIRTTDGLNVEPDDLRKLAAHCISKINSLISGRNH